MIEGEDGIIMKPIPTPEERFGSPKTLFQGKTPRQCPEDARVDERSKEKERIKGG